MNVHSEMVEVPGGMPAFVARPEGGPRPAVLVIQEAFGLNAHIEDVTRRLAAEGYVALAPDLYWRGGKGRTIAYEDIGEAIRIMQTLRDDQIVTDVGNAIAYLEKQASVRADRIAITGFCMGGRVSYLVACELPDKIKAAAPFYGGGIPIDKTVKLKAPVLAFFGEQDAFIPLEFVEELRREVAKHSKQVEIVVYPGAGHGFFCNERSSYDPKAAADAWQRLKTFFATHLGR